MTGERLTALLLSAFCLTACCLLPMDEPCQGVFTTIYTTLPSKQRLFSLLSSIPRDFPSNTGKMVEFSPQLLFFSIPVLSIRMLLPLTFLRLKTSALKLSQVLVYLALPHLALSLPSYIKVSHHISTASTRNERVYRETVTWLYSAQTERALHQLLQQCQGDSKCRRLHCVL